MSSITKQYLGYVAPEYANVDDERFVAIRATAEEFVDEKLFKTRTNYAVALYVAHMLKLGDGQGATGQIIERKVGDVSEKYQTSKNGVGDQTGLSQTTYGKQYLQVRKSILKTPIINS